MGRPDAFPEVRRAWRVLCLGASMALAAAPPKPTTPPSEKPSKPQIAPAIVIPLEGHVGLDAERLDAAPSTQQFVDDFILAKALEKAVASRPSPATVILEISGPGGNVSDAVAMIRRILRFQRDHPNIPVVGWIGPEAFSATAEIALACPTLVCKSQCSMGAAVIYTLGPDGRPVDARGNADDAVKRKFYSAMTSPLEEAQDQVGRPRCIERSMRVIEAQLWWSPKDGFKDAPGIGTEWERIDPIDEVLTLERSQLVRFGVCRGVANQPGEVIRLMGLPETTPIQRLDRTVLEARRTSIRRSKSLMEDVTVAKKTIAAASDALIQCDDLLLDASRRATAPNWSIVARRLAEAHMHLNTANELIRKRQKPPPGWEDSALVAWREAVMETMKTRLLNAVTAISRAETLAARADAGTQDVLRFAVDALFGKPAKE